MTSLFCLNRPHWRLLTIALLALPWTLRAEGSSPWTAVWMTSLQSIPRGEALPALYRAPNVAGRTVRQIVVPTLSGDEIRLHVSNRYAEVPLNLEDVRMAPSRGMTAATTGTGVPVTFAGHASLSLPPGGEADSDPIRVQLAARQPYAISAFVGRGQALQAWHRVASQTSYVSTLGDHAQDASAAAYTDHFTQFAWITSLAIRHVSAGAVLAIGDSITDGMRSTPGANRRWPDDLSRRLASGGEYAPAVLNAGISGNRLLSDSPCYGEKLLTRFERELDGQPDVRTAIVLIGINDINFAAMPARKGLDCDAPHTAVTAPDLIAGYRRVIEMAHRRHVRVLLGTLTPAGATDHRETLRLAVNQWIRSNHEADGVVDFDTALRDPAAPQNLRHDYDSGDHVHPSDAGYAAMAQAVPLPLLHIPVSTPTR